MEIKIDWESKTRIELLHKLIKRNNYKSYLEIGCNKDEVFSTINLEMKEGVDPNRGGTKRMTSDEFFNNDNRTWDLIFIDGLHEYTQVSRDFDNSFRRLNPNGTIVIHDMLPSSEAHAAPRPIEKFWAGDVWKLGFDLMARDDLIFNIFMFDFGCGIATKGNQVSKKVDGDKSKWRFYEDHYNKLPLIHFEDYFND